MRAFDEVAPSGTSAVSIADGADVAEGALADAANTTGTAGTISGKLRGIVQLLAAGLGITSVVPGTGATNLGKAEDSASASGDTGVFALAVRNDTLAALTTTDGDYSGIAVDSAGRVVPVGNVASGTTDSGSPVKVGAIVNTTPPTITNGQRVDAQADTRGYARGAQRGTSVTMTDGAGNAVTALALDVLGSEGNQLIQRVYDYAYAPTGTTSAWDRLRTPTIFKTAVATASGDTAIWTPTSGKKVRLMGYVIYVTANVTISGGGLLEIILRDATSAIGVGFSVFAPATALATFSAGDESGPISLGNGFLSAAANNVLNVNLSAAAASGEVRVVAWGTEE